MRQLIAENAGLTCSYTTEIALTKCFPICSSLKVKAHLISSVAIHLVSQWIRARSFPFDTSINLLATKWDKEVGGYHTYILLHWFIDASVFQYMEIVCVDIFRINLLFQRVELSLLSFKYQPIWITLQIITGTQFDKLFIAIKYDNVTEPHAHHI